MKGQGIFDQGMWLLESGMFEVVHHCLGGKIVGSRVVIPREESAVKFCGLKMGYRRPPCRWEMAVCARFKGCGS